MNQLVGHGLPKFKRHVAGQVTFGCAQGIGAISNKIRVTLGMSLCELFLNVPVNLVYSVPVNRCTHAPPVAWGIHTRNRKLKVNRILNPYGLLGR